MLVCTARTGGENCAPISSNAFGENNLSTQTSAVHRPSKNQLGRRSGGLRFGIKLTAYLVLVAGGMALALSGATGARWAGVLLLGAMFAHGVELQHQVLHSQGFAHPRFNEWTGMLLGLPMLVSYASYQASHMRHHRLLGTPADKEYFDYGGGNAAASTHPLARVAHWSRCLLMPAHYVGFARQAWNALRGRPVEGETEAVSRRVRRDHLFMLAALASALAASALWRPDAFLLAWLIPLLCVATPVHALIELPEHHGCDRSSTDVLRNTRTIRSNAFMTWYTNGNNFHVEHHLRPACPIDRLSRVHAEHVRRLPHFHRGYLAFYGDLLRGRIGAAAGSAA